MRYHLPLVLWVALCTCGCSSPKKEPVTKTDLPRRYAPAIEETRVETASTRQLTLPQHVAGAEAIAIGTILDFEPALPSRPAEWRIRFHVDQVLKGKLTSEVVILQTPTKPDSFIQSDRTWILMLDHGFLIGRRPYGEIWNKRFVDDVNAAIESDGA